jgi:hypothetical protein
MFTAGSWEMGKPRFSKLPDPLDIPPPCIPKSSLCSKELSLGGEGPRRPDPSEAVVYNPI